MGNDKRRAKTGKHRVPEARFFDDLDLDSIDAVDLIVRLRNEVDFDVSADDFKTIRTVGDLLQILERLAAKR